MIKRKGLINGSKMIFSWGDKTNLPRPLKTYLRNEIVGNKLTQYSYLYCWIRRAILLLQKDVRT